MSKLPLSNRCQLRPRSRLTSLPLGPTTIATFDVTHAAPERYSFGACADSVQVAPPSFDSASASGACVGVAKSPPTARPCWWSRNARAKIPAVGPLRIGSDGLAGSGVLVRHLVLPGGVAAPQEIMRLVAAISPGMWVNVLSQYRPVHEAQRFPVVARTARAEEVREAVGLATAAGLRNVLLDGRPTSRQPEAASRKPDAEAC